MAKLFSNFIPKQSDLLENKQVTNDWRAFFSCLPARTGPEITVLPTDGTATPADFTTAINAILTEMRAQKWIDSSTTGDGSAGSIANAIRALCMIPAAGDFVYNTTDVQYDIGDGIHVTLNSHSDDGYTGTDFSRSLDDVQSELPNVRTISLFVGWFFDDLRAGQCQMQPRVDNASKFTGTSAEGEGDSPLTALPWRVAGLYRNQVPVVSQAFGSPAYGSTPSDSSVLEGIAELKRRGFQVVFTPFLFGEIPSGSTLPDPSGTGTQAAYPWRGRIRALAASDKTAAAATEIDAFVNGVNGYRRFILHYANLCATAGDVDVFVIGSEMRGLTWSRSSTTDFPFVDALVTLAGDVKEILPNAKIIYTADWSEWSTYNPGDGSGDLLFHLDKLWANSAIDAIGIDNYMPLSDWRVVPVNSSTNLDGAITSNIYDWDYLMARATSGEGWEWYYADQAGRDAQDRLSITDGAYGKPWAYRPKDILNWWSNTHRSRIGGAEVADDTPWVPQSKPVWFMELGCPAVDKGSNQPNVFIDLKSSESFLPYYSSSARDDLIQRRHIQAWLRVFDESDTIFDSRNNPVSTVYGSRMVDARRMFVYTWDARPYAVFPERGDIWSDTDNWTLGDWLTGRIPDISGESSTSSGGTQNMLTKTITVPITPYIVDTTTLKLETNSEWYKYLEALGYTRQAAISSVSSEASNAELAETINEILDALVALNRIAGS